MQNQKTFDHTKFEHVIHLCVQQVQQHIRQGPDRGSTVTQASSQLQRQSKRLSHTPIRTLRWIDKRAMGQLTCSGTMDPQRPS